VLQLDDGGTTPELRKKFADVWDRNSDPSSGVNVGLTSPRWETSMFARRSAFRPEDLSAISQIFEDVSSEVVADGVTCSAVLETEQTRIRVAQKVLALAASRWTDVQIKQLVLRACRNEAARRRREKKPQLVSFKKWNRQAATMSSEDEGALCS
jgi:hypothetical protein